MNDFLLKRVLLFAAAWNVLGGASALFDPAKHFAQLYTGSLALEDPLQLFFYRCTWINAIVLAALFALALIPPRRAPSGEAAR